MATADIKEKLKQLAAVHNMGQTQGRDVDNTLQEAILSNPKGLKRLSKRKLSDGLELRVFQHSDLDDYLAVVETPTGQLELSSHDDLDYLYACYKARTPHEYGFALIYDGEQCYIPIAPLWTMDASEDDSMAQSVTELESLWTTSWFENFFNAHLQTSMEGIFTTKNADVSVLDILAALDNVGLTYSPALEARELQECDLPVEAGGLYIRNMYTTTFGM